MKVTLTSRRALGRVALNMVVAAGVTLAAATGAQAAGKGVGVIDHDWSFEGPFGTWDQAQLQRGWQVYSEVCSSCHGLKYVSFRSLGDENGPGFPAEQVAAIAESFPNQIPTVDEEWGEPTLRAPTPADKILSPYPNEIAAQAANGGAYPPDLSLMAKARTGYTGIIGQITNGIGGSEYIYSLLLGYQDEPPEGFEVAGVLAYNKYYPGHQIAMSQPLYEDSVEYMDGTPATIEQMSADVAAFLTWAAEPSKIERKEAGLRNVLFLTIFAVLLWYSNKKLWAPIKEGKM